MSACLYCDGSGVRIAKYTVGEMEDVCAICDGTGKEMASRTPHDKRTPAAVAIIEEGLALGALLIKHAPEKP